MNASSYSNSRAGQPGSAAFRAKQAPARPQAANLGWRVVVRTQKILQDQASAQVDIRLQKRVLCRNLLRRLQVLAAKSAAARVAEARAATAAAAGNGKGKGPTNAANLRAKLSSWSSQENLAAPKLQAPGPASEEQDAVIADSDSDTQSDTDSEGDRPAPTKAEAKAQKKLRREQKRERKREQRAANPKGRLLAGLRGLTFGRPRRTSSTDSSSIASSSSSESSCESDDAPAPASHSISNEATVFV